MRYPLHAMQPVTLRYKSGEEIKKGDHVLFYGNPAKVELAAWDTNDPETSWYVNEYGGEVLIFDPMVSGRSFIPKDQLEAFEELEFVSRADSSPD